MPICLTVLWHSAVVCWNISREADNNMLLTMAYWGGIRRCLLASHTLIFSRIIYRRSAWTSGARPSVAYKFTLKRCYRMHQNMPFSFRKLKKILRTGHIPSPDPTSMGRGDPFPPTSSAPSALNPWPPLQNVYMSYVTGYYYVMEYWDQYCSKTHCIPVVWVVIVDAGPYTVQLVRSCVLQSLRVM